MDKLLLHKVIRTTESFIQVMHSLSMSNGKLIRAWYLVHPDFFLQVPTCLAITVCTECYSLVHELNKYQCMLKCQQQELPHRALEKSCMYSIHSCPCNYWFSLLLITKYHLKDQKSTSKVYISHIVIR